MDTYTVAISDGVSGTSRGFAEGVAPNVTPPFPRGVSYTGAFTGLGTFMAEEGMDAVDDGCGAFVTVRGGRPGLHALIKMNSALLRMSSHACTSVPKNSSVDCVRTAFGNFIKCASNVLVSCSMNSFVFIWISSQRRSTEGGKCRNNAPDKCTHLQRQERTLSLNLREFHVNFCLFFSKRHTFRRASALGSRFLARHRAQSCWPGKILLRLRMYPSPPPAEGAVLLHSTNM